MSQQDIRQTTTTDTEIDNFEITPVSLDTSTDQKETEHDNPDYAKNWGFYEEDGAFGASISTFGTWIVGQGWKADPRTTAILENMDGWGEDTFGAIMWNLIVTKKVQGDAFAEIIRADDDGRVLNLKPTGTIRIVTNKKGRVIRYEEIEEKQVKSTFQPNEILHLCNNRIANQIHGTSMTKRVKWAIEARKEAMTDWKRISHISTIRILYVDENDKAKLTQLNRDYKTAIEKGHVLIIPGKPAEKSFQDLNLPPVEAYLAWLRYLENIFYLDLGIPKPILGGTAENTEASAKISVLVFDPIFIREQKELEDDLWNQVAIKVKFNRQPSLMDNVQTQENKNQAQTGFQPSDAQAPTL